MWFDVEWWCAVKCGCGIPTDVEWFDTLLHGGVMQNDS